VSLAVGDGHGRVVGLVRHRSGRLGRDARRRLKSVPPLSGRMRVRPVRVGVMCLYMYVISNSFKYSNTDTIFVLNTEDVASTGTALFSQNGS
jgi:hypothetical protein